MRGARPPQCYLSSPVLNQSAESATPPCSNGTGAEAPKPTSMTHPPLATNKLGAPTVDDDGVEVKLEPKPAIPDFTTRLSPERKQESCATMVAAAQFVTSM